MRDAVRKNRAGRRTRALLGAAIIGCALSCSDGGGGGSPTAPASPLAPPPPPVSTFQPVCSPIGPDGSHICIADLSPAPGTQGSPTITHQLTVRLTGKTPPEVAGKVYHAYFVYGEENRPPELGNLDGPPGLRLPSGEFDGEALIRISIGPGQPFRVCALLEREAATGGQREQLFYSPWVEGYRIP